MHIMLKFGDMAFSRSLLIHEEKPAGGPWLRLIITVSVGSLLMSGIYLWSSGDEAGGCSLMGEAVFVLALFRAVLPRSYQVYEDGIRIVLGAWFSVKIPFDIIEKIEVSSATSFTINFATAFTTRYILIKKKKGMSIAITPASNELFAENAGTALARWQKTRAR